MTRPALLESTVRGVAAALVRAQGAARPRRARGAWRDQAGSVFVEVLIVFPVFAALWLLTIYALGFYSVSIDNQRGLRECAWAYATSGCQQVPGDCPGSGRAAVADAPLRGAARGGFETVRENLPFLGASLLHLHGHRFEMARTRWVSRPRAFGGRVPTSFAFHMGCNAVPESWTTASVFALTCRRMGAFCP